MMQYMITCEKPMPASMSVRAARSSSRVTLRRSATVRWPAAFISSTSEEACQKKRYGEMVVPSTATSAAMKPGSSSSRGMNVDVMTAPTPGRTKNTVTTYANSASVRYLKILKMVEHDVNSAVHSSP